MADPPQRPTRGPFRAGPLRDGDRYERSTGQLIYWLRPLGFPAVPHWPWPP